MTTIIVFFDETCPLCRQLAAYAERRATPDTVFRGWQSFTSSREHREQLPAAGRDLPASELRVLYNGELSEGAAAWALLMAHHPDLRALEWLARRLGLASETARVLRSAGALLRALCPRCPRRAPPVRTEG